MVGDPGKMERMGKPEEGGAVQTERMGWTETGADGFQGPDRYRKKLTTSKIL